MKLLMRFTDTGITFVLMQRLSGLYEMAVYGMESKVITQYYDCSEMIDELLSWY